MRLIKMFGLAALAAVAAMAFVGATSAMAESTTLCETDTNELGCAKGTEATHVHFTTLTGEKAKLLSSILTVECDVLYLGDSLGLASPNVIHGNFTYSNCLEGEGGGCEAKELSSSALISTLKTGVEEGEVTFEYEVLMKCGAFIHCVYNGTGLKAHALGSLENGHVTITKQTTTKVSGFLCPKTATLDIITGSLTSLYIRGGTESTTLCETDTNELGCAKGTEATHVHFTTLSGEKAKLLSSILNVECDVLYLGDSLGLAVPNVIHGNFTYSNCVEESGGGGCEAKELSSSALISTLKTGVEEAEVTFQHEVLMKCGIFLHCVYNGTGLKAHALGSLENGHMTITKQTTNKISGFLCPKTATLDLLIGSLTSLYIRS